MLLVRDGVAGPRPVEGVKQPMQAKPAVDFGYGNLIEAARALRGPSANAPNLSIQAKLTVSKPGDPLEQEADRIAERMMHSAEPSSIGAAFTPADGGVGQTAPLHIALAGLQQLKDLPTGGDQPTGCATSVLIRGDPRCSMVIRPEASRRRIAAPLAPVNVIDAALVTALERASAAGEWSTMAILAGELAARRTAAAASPCTSVHDIESARRKRDGWST